MRSRYVAYALGRLDYVLDTWHPSTRPDPLAVSPPSLVWTRLTIKSHHEQGDQATVLFVAVSKENGRAQRMTERSRFVREAGRWFYVDGEVS
jgi:SEC-C motif-containing protein